MSIKYLTYIALYASERLYYRWQANMDKPGLRNKAWAIVLFDRTLNSTDGRMMVGA